MGKGEGERDRGDTESDLTELLTETRILLPGTEVFLAFLTTLPFTNRFESLTGTERVVYMCTFFSTLLAFATLVAPSAYHRICRPIRDKARFKSFANAFLVASLAPISLSIVLVAYLISSIVMGARYSLLGAGIVAGVVAVLWWVIPLLRAHDRFGRRGA